MKVKAVITSFFTSNGGLLGPLERTSIKGTSLLTSLKPEYEFIEQTKLKAF